MSVASVSGGFPAAVVQGLRAGRVSAGPGSPGPSRLAAGFQAVRRRIGPALWAVLVGLCLPAAGLGQHTTAHELSPGVRPQPYDYFAPVQSGSFQVLVTPTDVWEQVTPASVAGLNHAGVLPLVPGAGEPDAYGAQILEDLAKRHFLDVIIAGAPESFPPALREWFFRHGAATVREVRAPDLYRRSVELADLEVSAPRCVAFTTFHPLAAHLAALDGGPAFPLRHETSLPPAYREYLQRNRNDIQRVFLVDVAGRISPSQAVYQSYGNLAVPASVEEEVRQLGFPLERITGEWEEEVSVAAARKAESIYREAVAAGRFEHLPLGWVPTSSLRSEWTNLAALIPFVLAKQWFPIEYWADLQIQGRGDSVEAYSDRYVEDFLLGMACLLPPAPGQTGTGAREGIGAEPGRRESALCTIYGWLSSYIKRTGIRDFILCEATGPYGENAAPIYNFEQVPGMILRWQMPDLLYRGWSGGGGLSGIDYDGAMAARKSCAVILLALERALFPPEPWGGRIEPAWPPREVDHWEEAPRAISLSSDYEGWYANVFLTPRLIEFARRKGIKLTLRPQGDISFCLPDYLRSQFEQGQGVIEFSNQGFLHEFDVLGFAPYPHGQLMTEAVERMERFAGIRMRGFMPAGGFLTSPQLRDPGIELGLQYAFCPPGKYLAPLDMLMDMQSREEAPVTGFALVSHFSERAGYLAYHDSAAEDVQDNIAALEDFFARYDEPPYAPYTAWHFVHGFQLPDEAAFEVLESVVDYLNENRLGPGRMVSVTLSDIARYFEEGSDVFRTPVVAEANPAPWQPAPGEAGGCGSCAHLPGASTSAGLNFLLEFSLLVALPGFALRPAARHRDRRRIFPGGRLRGALRAGTKAGSPSAPHPDRPRHGGPESRCRAPNL